MAQRATARTEKQWALSDEIRDAAAVLGWAISDTPTGQTAEKIR